MIEVDHKRAQLAYAKAQHKMAAQRLAMIHFSLREKYDTQLAAEAIALTAQVADLEAKLKILRGEAA